MEYLFWAVVIAVACWVFALHRGRKAVRAFIYLEALDHGMSVADANLTAIRLTFKSAARLQGAAMMMVHAEFGGKQLAMIAEARRRGFVE